MDGALKGTECVCCMWETTRHNLLFLFSSIRIICLCVGRRKREKRKIMFFVLGSGRLVPFDFRFDTLSLLLCQIFLSASYFIPGFFASLFLSRSPFGCGPWFGYMRQSRHRIITKLWRAEWNGKFMQILCRFGTEVYAQWQHSSDKLIHFDGCRNGLCFVADVFSSDMRVVCDGRGFVCAVCCA